MASQPHESALDAASLFNVNGLVALVTGGGTGIGLMMAKALAKNGAARVYIAGRRLEVLQNAAKSIGPSAVPIKCDVTSKSDLQAAVSVIERESGYLNLLVANSGIGEPKVAPLTPETTLEEWASANFAVDADAYTNIFRVNVAGVWFSTMAFLPLLDKGNKAGNVFQASQVVVTSSVAAFNKKAPGGFGYGQSKTAATLAMKQLAVALPQWNIRANCIAPGLYPSEMSEPILNRFKDADSGTFGSVPQQMVPLRRLGDEQDMGGTMLYLASRAGAYLNGAVILSDGGRLGHFPSIN